MQGATEPLQLCREDLLWSGLSLQILSEEELARRQGAVEDKVHFHRGVWWRQARLFFWMPCHTHSRVDHRESWPHPLRALAGFMHLAAPGTPSNGIYRAIIREDLTNYTIRSLSKDRRYFVRKALGHLNVRQVKNLHELITDGYEVYVSWRQRVQWGRDKSERAVFEAWMRRDFRQPKCFVLGAYSGNKLIAFMLPKVVGNAAMLSYVASHSDFLKYFPNDALFHAFLCIARQTPGVATADFGPVSSKASLDQFKLHYSSIKEFPSYTWINPLVRPMFNKWIRPRYPWLCGDATQASVNSENT